MTLYKKVITITFLLALLSSANIFSQTCKVRNAVLGKGETTYTEVFEYDYVDVKPEFPGGRSSLIKFINSNRQYPRQAYEAGIEGRVTCSFVVHADGKISHIQVLRGVEPSLNQEATRIINEMPCWTPGKIKEKPVPVRVVCYIPFRK